jgi:hypothetical protein
MLRVAALVGLPQVLAGCAVSRQGNVYKLGIDQNELTASTLQEFRIGYTNGVVRRSPQGQLQIKLYDRMKVIDLGYVRSKAVRDYVLMRAAGRCESCDQPAPFIRKNGTPYLEPHHTTRVSDGGPDRPRFVGAVCPACHRELHFGIGGEEKNAALQERLRALEPD